MNRVERFRRRGVRDLRPRTHGGWFVTNRSQRRREAPFRFDKYAFFPYARRRARSH